jgi:hypothetical protein
VVGIVAEDLLAPADPGVRGQATVAMANADTDLASRDAVPREKILQGE